MSAIWHKAEVRTAQAFLGGGGGGGGGRGGGDGGLGTPPAFSRFHTALILIGPQAHKVAGMVAEGEQAGHAMADFKAVDRSGNFMHQRFIPLPLLIALPLLPDLG